MIKIKPKPNLWERFKYGFLKVLIENLKDEKDE
jgi:hypothetical protein